MSVTFHPNNPIDALETIIIKDDGSPLHGEIDVYRKLWEDLNKSTLDWNVWHDLKLPDHSDDFNYYKKTSSQIDFLILCKHGLLVLEVKGGPISTKDSTFFYGKNFETPIKQNPFKQSEGYKYTLKDKVLNNFKSCFFCEATAFPHVDYPFESKLIDKKLLWTSFISKDYGNSIEKFILSVFEYSKEKHKKHFRYYDEISPKEQLGIKKILSPIIGDRSKFNSINTIEWLGVQNLELLDGLYKNSRIMIEGPPGCGKTTIAKAMLEQIGADYITINGSMNGNIDTLRTEISSFASSVSFSGGRKYVILDEADYLNPNSTQPALRNFMEEFSKNCGFILTCNFKNRIIEPLHSRCSVVEFKIANEEKQAIAGQFFKRVSRILEEENVEYDRSTVAEVIKTYFPDWRRVLNELQRYSSTGRIDSGVLANKSVDNMNALITLMKERNFTDVRKWVAENTDVDSAVLYRQLYDLLPTKISSTQSVADAIIILAEYQYKEAFVANSEINRVAALATLMAEVEWK